MEHPPKVYFSLATVLLNDFLAGHTAEVGGQDLTAEVGRTVLGGRHHAHTVSQGGRGLLFCLVLFPIVVRPFDHEERKI